MPYFQSSNRVFNDPSFGSNVQQVMPGAKNKPLAFLAIDHPCKKWAPQAPNCIFWGKWWVKSEKVKPWNVDVPTLRHNFLTSYWKLLHALQGMADPLQYSYSRTVEAVDAHKCHCLALWPNIRFKKKSPSYFGDHWYTHTHTRNKKQPRRRHHNRREE